MKHVVLPALLGTLALAGCPKPESSESSTAASSAPAKGQPGANDPKPASKGDAAPPADAYDPEAALLDPTKASLTAPDTFTAKLETTKGDILIDVTRSWAPNGADRFYNLVKAGYYDDTAFFRVIGGFMAQVGISGDPKLNEKWRGARIPDDPVRESNLPGYVSFAASAAPNSRTTQFFINFGDNRRLDAMRFAPFGKVRDESMKVVRQLYAGYGEGAPRGKGPSQARMQTEGNAYLRKEFPKLDYIEKATILDN